MKRSIAFAAAAVIASATVMADTALFIIVDDEEVESALHASREWFLQRVDFDRLDATILILQEDGTWLRGSHNPDALAYPASTVKLAYLAAAMHWSQENGHPYNHLDDALRPMIVMSDNVQTGVVVDALTGAPNIDDLTEDSDPRYAEWLDKRHYTARFLDARGLLDDQVIIHKTYPTNSGRMPAGAEKVVREALGQNVMSPRLSASLMLEVAKGGFDDEATAYMHELLDHDRWRGNSVIATAIPPGSTYLNKPGYAYDTLEDFAHVTMPNGREFVLAIFTNGWIPQTRNDPSPYGRSFLGMFAEDLIIRLGLDEENPPRLRIDNDDPAFTSTGEWTRQSDKTQWGESYLLLTSGEGTATWNLNVPAAGRYEICVLYPRIEGLSTEATYTVHAAAGEDRVTINQSVAGGQWVRVGDFNLEEGKGAVTLHGVEGETVAADAVRAMGCGDMGS